jgi:hypothetical protein
MSKTIPLDELSQMQLEENKDKAALDFRNLEGQFWDAWRWRRRVARGFPHLAEVRREVVVAHMDALFKYIEHQRCVIHQLLAVTGRKEGRLPVRKLYAELLDIAGRYDLEGKLIRPGRRGPGES